MVNEEDPNEIPENPRRKQPEIIENGQKDDFLFSPRFRSMAAMAGWDEEALMVASLIVEDTPDSQIKHRKRSILKNLKTPPTNSRRKRRAQRRSPVSIPVASLDLDEDDQTVNKEKELVKIDAKIDNTKEELEKKTGDEAKGVVLNASPVIPCLDRLREELSCAVELEKKTGDEAKGVVLNASPVIPCLDRLREELSCAICLEICYEPSTTSCGHSFCIKCLKSAADKCGKKCPKCRQLISNGRHCTVNTVLWNTIQLLFPKEVEARKVSSIAVSDDSREPRMESLTVPRRISLRNRSFVQALNSPENENMDRERRVHQLMRSRSSRGASSGSSGEFSVRRRLPSQDEDAALALRLQRVEFMEAFREPVVVDERTSMSSLVRARANLRAMASRAINFRIRDRI